MATRIPKHKFLRNDFMESGMPDYSARRDRLLSLLQAEGLDAFLITHPLNVSYLTGFTGDSSALILTAERTVFVSDGRFTTQLKEECPDLEAYIRPPIQPLTLACAVSLEKLGVGNVGFESGHLTVADHQTIKDQAKTLSWKAGTDWVERFRQIKEEGEIAAIRSAIRMAERAFAMFRAMLRPEDDEKSLADALEQYVRRAGGKCTSFAPIVAVGPRAALPHATPSTVRVQESHHLLIDWGAAETFYKSDLTRVLLTHNNGSILNQKELAKLKEVYEVVLRAQAAAIAVLRPGVPAKDVDAAARAIIAQAGYGDYFTHSIGHGIGMAVHEGPMMRANTETPLAAGMVVTVEPGIYLPDWGGVRIEDDVLVTPDGHEVLSHVPKAWDANIVEF